MADSAIRHRKKGKDASEPSQPSNSPDLSEQNDESTLKEDVVTRPSPKARIKSEDSFNLTLDILRFVTFLFVASCGLSYLATGGESWFWGSRHGVVPSYMRLDWWQKQFRGPITLTLDELAEFDGSDETKPIYIAVNGTIFDVSNGRRIYGPGGSYQWFAGVDASRAFVTGCFSTDRTADMRGVEEMFLPLDDPETDSQFSPDELAQMKKDELEKAHEQVYTALKHWVDFFTKSEKYSRVGILVREPGWEDKEERKELCEAAQKNRRKRKVPPK